MSNRSNQFGPEDAANETAAAVEAGQSWQNQTDPLAELAKLVGNPQPSAPAAPMQSHYEEERSAPLVAEQPVQAEPSYEPTPMPEQFAVGSALQDPAYSTAQAEAPVAGTGYRLHKQAVADGFGSYHSPEQAYADPFALDANGTITEPAAEPADFVSDLPPVPRIVADAAPMAPATTAPQETIPAYAPQVSASTYQEVPQAGPALGESLDAQLAQDLEAEMVASFGGAPAALDQAAVSNPRLKRSLPRATPVAQKDSNHIPASQVAAEEAAAQAYAAQLEAEEAAKLQIQMQEEALALQEAARAKPVEEELQAELRGPINEEELLPEAQVEVASAPQGSHVLDEQMTAAFQQEMAALSSADDMTPAEAAVGSLDEFAQAGAAAAQALAATAVQAPVEAADPLIDALGQPDPQRAAKQHPVTTPSLKPQSRQPSEDLEDILLDLNAPAVVRETQASENAEPEPAFGPLPGATVETNVAGEAFAAEYGKQGEMRASIAAGIDDMSWPQAAEHIGQDDEDLFALDDKQQAPAQGYDLSEVAEAMAERDPSVRHGVLPGLPPVTPQVVEEKKSPGTQKGVMAAAAVGAVIVLGGLGATFIDFGGGTNLPNGEPPLVHADSAPMKKFPQVADADQNSDDQLILPAQSDLKVENEVMLPRENAAVEPLPPAPVAGEDVSTAVVANAPKKVRTITVRPDGTLDYGNENGAKSLADQLLAAQRQAQHAGTTGDPKDMAWLNQNGNEQAAAAPVDNGPTNLLPDVPQRSVSTQPITRQNGALPQTGGAVTTTASVAPNPFGIDNAAAVAPNVETRPLQKPLGGVQVAAAPQSAGQPLDLTGGAQVNQPQQPVAARLQPTAPAANMAGAAYVVQLSSVRSEDMAANEISSFQRRFPSLMQGVRPAVVRADLGEKGIYYRVRVPFGDKDGAINFCTSLKEAGGDCFVRRNS
ncbi:SPOR domain-containing protein [Polycladidibacter hongkongensis]|uniref:SPOR domain-containing protein n=1 Tax=Polycladidibacter hongkongensis TaxID=1647556 RepID=UPI00083580E3|nr:SPOR domain-containing protein [Pseudovibrio hongkongensis]